MDFILVSSWEKEGVVELPLEPVVIVIGSSKTHHSNSKSGKAPIHIFGHLTLIHEKAALRGVDIIKFGALYTLVVKEEDFKVVPWLFGGLARAHVSAVLRSHRQWDHAKGGGIELIINHLPSREIFGIVRVKSLLYHPP
jgi:hypothetical protein